ncbi:MAG: DUF4342 domain-containing protein [Myxococcales bacterium]|nr:DUF4342 domain-containing protein [Myxococcales bacterium]
MKDPVSFETFSIDGDQLLQRVKELIHEGNVRHIRIKQDGHTILELPLTVGVIGVVLMPMLAAVGALAALVSNCTIEVERRPDDPPANPPEVSDGGPTT